MGEIRCDPLKTRGAVSRVVVRTRGHRRHVEGAYQDLEPMPVPMDRGADGGWDAAKHGGRGCADRLIVRHRYTTCRHYNDCN